MKLFITGIAGKIAEDLAAMGIFDGHQVVGFDKAPTPTADLTNINGLRACMPEGIDLILHLANISYPDPEIPIVAYVSNNVKGCENLLTVAKEKKAKGIVFFSSLAAVGFDAGWFFKHTHGGKEGPNIVPGDEKTAKTLSLEAWDIDRYGCSNVHQEKMIAESGLPYLILRLGPYRGDVVYTTQQVVYNILGGQPLTSGIIHIPLTPEWGGQKMRDFLTEEHGEPEKKVVKKGARKRGRPKKR